MVAGTTNAFLDANNLRKSLLFAIRLHPEFPAELRLFEAPTFPPRSRLTDWRDSALTVRSVRSVAKSSAKKLAWRKSVRTIYHKYEWKVKDLGGHRSSGTLDSRTVAILQMRQGTSAQTSRRGGPCASARSGMAARSRLRCCAGKQGQD